MSAEELIKNLNEIPENIRTAVRNNAGGHVNHSLFWNVMRKGEEGNAPQGKIASAINKKFSSFEEFKKQFSECALNRVGSGWAWLVVNSEGDLEIVSTANQDNPLSEGKIPILGLDVWEHAYYIKWNSNRAGYIDSWWHVVNWEEVEENYLNV